MKHSSLSKLVRALCVFAIILLAALLLKKPRLFGGVSKDRVFLGAGEESALDLAPDIVRGLDLLAEQAQDFSPPSVLSLSVFDDGSILDMELEDYIVCVTAAEMPVSFELEALKAQAVAARTFTLKHMTGDARCKSDCTICTDYTCCQAFISVERMKRDWGADFERKYAKIKRAVNETCGQVLMSDGKLVSALYHSSSGGMTESSEAVFAVAVPYLVAVESDGEESFPQYKGAKTFKKDEFIKLINDAFPDAFMSDPKKDIDIWQRSESGRITLIRLGGTVRTGQQLRKALSLRSTNAHFTITDDAVTIVCYGHGHGVGMSQCGANAMAKRGASYEEILKHYYTGVAIELCFPKREPLHISAP